MRICYQDKTFRADTLDVIHKANQIATNYQDQGYSLTLRQLYYRFVAEGLLPNTDKSYKRLGGIVNDARLAGLMDWSHITDRTRFLREPNTWADPSQIIRASADQFKRDTWAVSGQRYRPEVWVEKDALVDVVSRGAAYYDVPVFSCRGYVSQSEMWAAGRRMMRHYRRGNTPVVFHLGDHDPSGLDMTRDIADRLAMFAEAPVEVVRLALNMDQIQQYDPPPNPAKLTDSRGSAYVEQYGPESWELDALEPSVLVDLIVDAVAERVSHPAWAEAQDDDAASRSRMSDVADNWAAVETRWDEVAEALDLG